MTHIKIFEVGGSIRDQILGLPNKDRDFCAVAPSWDALHEWCEQHMDQIFLVKPEFLTVRGFMGGEAIDIVMCRKDGPSTDGRRPDSVTPGTLMDDLSRRDFTMNAMAIEVDHNLNQIGEIIDPFNGAKDAKDGILRCVGSPELRMAEDGLRIVRAMRFQITKGVELDAPLWRIMRSREMWEFVQKSVSVERIRQELDKCFKHDTADTLRFLGCLENPVTGEPIVDLIFTNGLWLSPSLAKK